MPTTHPRHTITETPAVRAALDALRERLRGERIDYAELVALGARVKARRLPDEAGAAREAAGRLAAMMRGRAVPIDVRAADEVKRLRLSD
jgi:pyrimidine operon attenuation protein/uracil phosphoribosyltransferase